MKKFRLPLALALAFVLAVSLLSVLLPEQAYAEMPTRESILEKIYNRQYDVYTDTDFLDKLAPSGNYKIQTYALNWKESYADGKDKDNDVVKIIPRELFAVQGEYAYVGEEYGFYINTVSDARSGSHNVNYSEVLVFDIKYDNEKFLSGEDSFYTYKVQNLFSHRYYYLQKSAIEPQFVLSEKYYTERISSSATDIVVAGDSKDRGVDLSLKTVMVSSTLINEYEVNTDDAAYSADDDGMFFVNVESGYYLVRPDEEMKTKRLNFFLDKLISFSINAVSTVFPEIKVLYEGVKSAIELGKLFSSGLNPTVVQSSGNITADGEFVNPYMQEYNVSKNEQLRNYGGILKSAMCFVDLEDEEYLEGDFFASKFTVNKGINSATRIENRLFLTIANGDSSYSIVGGTNDDGKSVTGDGRRAEFESGAELGLLPQGERQYVFTPERNGYYSFTAPEAVELSGLTDEEQLAVSSSTVAGKERYYLYGGEKYVFSVRNPERGTPENVTSRLRFSVECLEFHEELILNEAQSFGLNAGEYVIYRFAESAAPCYKLTSQGNASILSALDSLYFENACSLSGDATLSFVSLGDGYVKILNDSSSYSMFSLKAETELYLNDGAQNVEYALNFKRYLNLSPALYGNYRITVSSDETVQTVIRGDGFVQYSPYPGNSYMWDCFLSAGETYYLEIMSDSGSGSVELKIEYTPIAETFVFEMSDIFDFTVVFNGVESLTDAYLTVTAGAFPNFFTAPFKNNKATIDLGCAINLDPFRIYYSIVYKISGVSYTRSFHTPVYYNSVGYGSDGRDEIIRENNNRIFVTPDKYLSGTVFNVPERVKVIYIAPGNYSEFALNSESGDVKIYLDNAVITGMKYVDVFRGGSIRLRFAGDCAVTARGGDAGADGTNGAAGAFDCDGQNGANGTAGLYPDGKNAVSCTSLNIDTADSSASTLLLRGGDGGRGGSGGKGGDGGKGSDGEDYFFTVDAWAGGGGGKGGDGAEGGSAGLAADCRSISTDTELLNTAVVLQNGIAGQSGDGGKGGDGGDGGNAGSCLLEMGTVPPASGGLGGVKGEGGKGAAAAANVAYVLNGVEYCVYGTSGRDGEDGSDGAKGEDDESGVAPPVVHTHGYSIVDMNGYGLLYECYGCNLLGYNVDDWPSSCSHDWSYIDFDNYGTLYLCGDCGALCYNV